MLTTLWHKIANLDKPFTTTITDFVSEVPFKVMTVMSPGGNITALKMVAASLAALVRGLNIYGFISSLPSPLPKSPFLANEVYFRVTSYLRKKTWCDFSACLMA